MGKKKKKREEEYKPWCFYCDRVFLDETTLITHQKAKHFKCSVCHKKMTTAPSLAVHFSHVHKTTLDKVPGSKPGRSNVELEIFGMAGVPEGMRPGEPFPTGEDGDEPAAKVPRLETGSLAPPPRPTTLPPPGSLPAPGAPRPQAYRPIVPPQYPGFPGMLPPGPRGPPMMPMGMPPFGFSRGLPPGVLPPYGAPGLPPGSVASSSPATPLFPIASAPPGAQQPPQGQPSPVPAGGPGTTPLFPIPNGASVLSTGGATEGKKDEPVPAVSDAKMVWTESQVSMEERRAELPKYVQEA